MSGQGYNFGGAKAERLLKRMREIKAARKKREAIESIRNKNQQGESEGGAA